MKYNLLGAVSTLAMGAALGLLTTQGAHAVLVCNPGSPGDQAVGSGYTCTSTASFTGVANSGTSLTNTQVGTFTVDGLASLPDVSFPKGQHLTGVHYKLTGAESVGQNLANSGGIIATGNVAIETAALTLQSTGSTPANFLTAGSTQVTKALVHYPTITLAANSTAGYAFSANLPTLSAGSSVSQSSIFGLSSFSVNVQFTEGGSLTGTSNAGAVTETSHFTVSSIPSLVVTYTYNTTTQQTGAPEPATLALLGVGLAGVGAVRRRRKQ